MTGSSATTPPLTVRCRLRCPRLQTAATAVSITAGSYHTCALLNTGAVNCWGYNFDGQLGNGTTTYSSAPVAVAAFTDGATAVSITAGDFHTCALLNTGAVNCWGSNSDGQLGNGTTTNSSVPAKVMLFVPGVPTGVSGVAGDSEVVVSWTAPVSDGGSVISSYTVTSSPHNKTCTTTGALTCTVAGLTNATAYTFTVAATNYSGDWPRFNSIRSGHAGCVVGGVDAEPFVGDTVGSQRLDR